MSGSCISIYVFLTSSKGDMGGGGVLPIPLRDHSSCRSYPIISTAECLMVTRLVTCSCLAPHTLGLQSPAGVHRHSGASQEDTRGLLAAGMGAASSRHHHADCGHGERAGECPAASQNDHQVAYPLLAGVPPYTPPPILGQARMGPGTWWGLPRLTQDREVWGKDQAREFLD